MKKPVFMSGAEAAALVDHCDEAAAGAEVLLVNLEVLGEFLDASGQQGDLNLDGTAVIVGALELLDGGQFFFFGHDMPSMQSALLTAPGQTREYLSQKI